MDVESEYNNRARVPEHPMLLEGWARDAAAYRAGHHAAELGLAYGPGERERLDLFWPASGPGGAAPVVLFLHGGYWQALDRSWISHCACGLNARGVAVAMPSTDLCPAVTLARIVDQARAAAAFLYRRHGRQLLASGHSAGGHLAAMLMATNWRAIDPALPADLVPAGLPLSGVFELEPLLPTSIAPALALDGRQARALSPRFLPAPASATLHAVVGAEESAEFLRQTRDFAAAWGGNWEALPGANHFTALAPLADPAHKLVARAAAMAARAAAGAARALPGDAALR